MVIIASTRAAAGVYPDRTGPVIVEWLQARKGFARDGPQVVADGPIRCAARPAISRLGAVDLVITSGGTGISPTDRTPQVTADVLDYEIPGLAEQFRRCGQRRGADRGAVPRARRASPGAPWWSTCPARPAACATGWPCWTGCSTTRWTNCAAATTQQGRRSVSGRVVATGVSAEPLEPRRVLASVDDPAAGARCRSSGVVRNHDGGRTVTALEYHGHPTASAVVAEVADEIAARDGVLAVAVVAPDRACCGIGDDRALAAVSAAHRAEAFAACSDLVDEVKRRLPVWKRQVFDDGTDEWVGSA